MTTERRKEYRVRTDLKALSFRVHVFSEGSADTGATILDLSSTGIALGVAPFNGPPFSSDAIIGLRFAFAGQDGCILRAAVRWCRSEPGRYAYGLEFIDPVFLHSVLPTRLFELFNRREWRRASVAEPRETPVWVQRESDASRLHGQLHDISPGGCALTLDAAPAINPGARMEVGFSLPTFQPEFNFIGKVSSIGRADQLLRCGLEFDPQTSNEFALQRSRLMSYVSRQTG